MPDVNVLECEEVTDEFEQVSLQPGERVFRVRYVDPAGYIKTRHVTYVPARGFSPNPVIAALQRVCIEMTKKRREAWLQK